MRPYLLDTNVLLALAWAEHVSHEDVQGWFGRKRAAGFFTCPLTEIGFIRISSNPAFTTRAVSPSAALGYLRAITEMPEHGFWADSISFHEAAGKALLSGHRQVTDLYLLALAKAHGGMLATLDKGAVDMGRRFGYPAEIID